MEDRGTAPSLGRKSLLQQIIVFFKKKKKERDLAALGFCCCAQALSSCSEQGLLSLSNCGAWASHCGDFCCGSQAPEVRLSNCGTWT